MSSGKQLKRRPDGTLLPGQGAINPGGRPKGIERRMRELVDSQIKDWDGRTLDGWEAMTVMMFKIAMGERPPGEGEITISMKDRMAAAQFLFDRVYGKAKILVESDTTLHSSGMANLDVDSLSREELEALEAHVEGIAARAMGKSVGRVISVAPSDVEEYVDSDADLIDEDP